MKFLLLTFSILLTACQSMPAQGKIDAAQTEKLLKETAGVQLVDLRTPGEWKQTGVIEGAIKINFNGPDFASEIGKLDKNKPVIVYCAAGGRSARATQQMEGMGFKTVYDYTGGMNDWKAKGKKTTP